MNATKSTSTSTSRSRGKMTFIAPITQWSQSLLLDFQLIYENGNGIRTMKEMRKTKNRLFNLKVTESSLTSTPREYVSRKKIDALIPKHLSCHDDLFPFYSPFA